MLGTMTQNINWQVYKSLDNFWDSIQQPNHGTAYCSYMHSVGLDAQHTASWR
jgi:hypothetical protein